MAGPGEALFEGVRLSGDGGRPQSPAKEILGYNSNPQNLPNDVLVPASMASPPPLRPSTGALADGPPRGGRRAKKAISPSVAFDEYFKEGEQKSQEEDFAPRSKAGAPPPPPPGTKVVISEPRVNVRQSVEPAEDEEPKSS